MNEVYAPTQKQAIKLPKNWLSPSRIIALGFATVILMGALLLHFPISTADGKGLPFLNALFTSTSAVCVTGLAVVDTGTVFSTFGQAVILVLIQVGGLGFMTFATLYAIALGKRINLKERLLLQEAYNHLSLEGIVRLARNVIIFSFAIESIGVVILAIRWSFDMKVSKAIYYALFHTVSAFNNAGFDLFGNSLMNYTGDIVTNITIMLLIVLGGLGFCVLSDLHANRGKKITLHSRIVLYTTGILILAGAGMIFILERTNSGTLGPLDPLSKVLTALFQAVTPRTAGFNTIDITALREPTRLFIIILMFIGASPGSTGGGIKTTTFVSIVLLIISTFKNKCNVTFQNRTLPREIIQKALAITSLALTWIIFITFILTITEHADFLVLLFETVSAFATVGLSLGITSHLTVMGKLAIILTMFVGRVGVLTIGFALGKNGSQSLNSSIKYPEEKIIIG